MITQILLENKIENYAVVSPDMGAQKRAKAALDYLIQQGFTNGTVAVMDKKRVEANKVEGMELL